MVVKELKPLLLASLVCLAGHPLFGLTDAGKNLLEQLRKRSAAPPPVETPADQLSIPAPVLVPPPTETVAPAPAPSVAGEPAPGPKPAERKKAAAPSPREEKSRGRRRHAGDKKPPAGPPAVVPVATESFRLKPPLTPAVAPASAALPDHQGKVAPAAAGAVASHRTFGEISDEELVQFAQEYVWRPEKSKKHNPPPTLPYRPKKKKEATAKPAAKSSVAPKAAGKTASQSPAKASKKSKTASGKKK